MNKQQMILPSKFFPSGFLPLGWITVKFPQENNILYWNDEYKILTFKLHEVLKFSNKYISTKSIICKCNFDPSDYLPKGWRYVYHSRYHYYFYRNDELKISTWKLEDVIKISNNHMITLNHIDNPPLIIFQKLEDSDFYDNINKSESSNLTYITQNQTPDKLIHISIQKKTRQIEIPTPLVIVVFTIATVHIIPKTIGVVKTFTIMTITRIINKLHCFNNI